jgi:ribosomal protein S18 acetylase RimI-like enzyme
MSCDTFTVDAVAMAAPNGPSASASTSVLNLVPIDTTDRRIEYCLALARGNMSPYLEQRDQTFDDTRWRNLAPRASFYLIVEAADAAQSPLGFLSIRDEPDAPTALHIGDIQLESQHRNRGIGYGVLQLVESMALRRGYKEITLNVFRDNPAQRLYERCGFCKIDMQFDKFKMRKTL